MISVVRGSFANHPVINVSAFSNVHTKHYITCTDKGALLRFGHCMTHDSVLNENFLATCIYFQLGDHNVTDTWMITLPDKTSELNDYMCGPMKRKGRICSECIDGYGPSYTSFGLQCSSCTGVFYGILYLLLVEVLPQTVFFLIVLMLRIRMTSAPYDLLHLIQPTLYCTLLLEVTVFLVSIQNKKWCPVTLGVNRMCFIRNLES